MTVLPKVEPPAEERPGVAAAAFDPVDRSTRTGTYREIAPPARLRDQVECFWHRAAGGARSRRLILPDGCIDVIWVGDRAPFVAGPATLATAVEPAAGAEVVGVRFRPGVAPHLLGVGAHELVDRDVPLRAIWPHDRAAGWLDAAAPSALDAKLHAIANLILDRVAAGTEGDPEVRRVVTWMAGHPHCDVRQITQLCAVGERQLRRRFAQSVGYGPKTLQRILRLQRLLWLAGGSEGAGLSLARLAIAAGYADQPHMTRETLALTGATPRQLLVSARRASAVSELFKTAEGRGATLTRVT